VKFSAFKAQFAITAVATAFALWLQPAVIRWLEPRVAAAQVQARAQESAEAEAARRYAALLVACLNGGAITDGTRVIECQPR
jgi:hypothetical protein